MSISGTMEHGVPKKEEEEEIVQMHYIVDLYRKTYRI